jgi:hypothetical protein
MSISQILVDRDLITQDQAMSAERNQKTMGGSLADNLVSLGYISREALDRVLHEVPRMPETLEETQLDAQFLGNLLLKTMYVTGLETPTDLADYVKLSPLVVDNLLQDAKHKRLAEVLGERGQQFRYALTDRGRDWALDAMSQSQYTGPAPVPLAAWRIQIMKDSLGADPVTDEDLERALSHLVVPGDIRGRIGPAVNSHKSILLYGASGNGKTSIAEAIASAFHTTVFTPHCVEVSGQIITVFDPALHHPVEEKPAAATASNGKDARELDPRWVRCRRPTVITGGELTMEMLDLTYDPISKYYEAPAHIKATGGVFIIDDFGRQRVPPGDLLNRWILPLERRVDYMTLRTGKKLEMPFDQLVIFSTNMAPQDLMDEAALRRVQYKFHVPAPTAAEYEKIFRRVCEVHGLELPDALLAYLRDVFYPKTGASPSGYHPRFIVEHVIATCHFEDVQPKLSIELARDALKNLVLTDVPDA